MNDFNKNFKYLVTGAAGFIGFYLSKRIMEHGGNVIGIDNLNDYYDVSLKEDRLKELEKINGVGDNGTFTFIKCDIADKSAIDELFKKEKPDVVVNLAAQAGVRYSIDHPDTYINSNIIGFFNILEACRYNPVKHLLYASSSSVYGGNTKVPFSTEDKVDEPVSLYAATKKSNELMAHAYSKLYDIPATGLRFFTVYGPMGRPDMALFLFANKIMKDQPIQIFNNGDMRRDFTYVDDIVTGVFNMLCNPPKPTEKGVRYKVYNIGNHSPEKLMDFVGYLEKALGKEAKKEFLPMQAGDVYQTYADVSELEKDFGFKPSTPLEEGVAKFVEWYKSYYNC
ncbi:MAG: NAD-dependent epimerase [Butyrivibrio sp.]|nr:NAD-dependent epimerase [Butyrivibrio sp.]